VNALFKHVGDRSLWNTDGSFTLSLLERDQFAIDVHELQPGKHKALVDPWRQFVQKLLDHGFAKGIKGNTYTFSHDQFRQGQPNELSAIFSKSQKKRDEKPKQARRAVVQWTQAEEAIMFACFEEHGTDTKGVAQLSRQIEEKLQKTKTAKEVSNRFGSWSRNQT
jgi:hypothetical protein